MDKTRNADKQDEKKKLVSELLEKFSNAKNITSTYYNAWDRYYKYFRSAISKTYNDYKQKRILPIAFSTIMSILPRILSLKPEVRYIMRKYPGNIDDILDNIERNYMLQGYEVDIQMIKKEAIELMDYIIGWQWDNMNGDAVLSENLLTSLIYGTSIVRVSWKDNAPFLENIEPYYFHPEPSARNPFEMNYCFIENYMSELTIKELFDSGYYTLPEDVDDYKKIIDSIGDEYSGYKDILTGKSEGQRYRDNAILVVEYYTKKEFIVIIGDYIVRRVKNPFNFIPIVVNYNYKLPNEFWGMSEIDQIEQFIDDMTDFRNNRHINMELTTNTMWQVDPDKEVVLEDLVAAPGQIVRAEDGALKPLVPPNVSPQLYNEDMLLKNDVRETSGISDYLRGGTPQRFETATAIENLVQSGNARINLRVENLINYFIKPLGKMLIEYNKRFLKPFNMSILTETGVEIIQIDTDLIKIINGEYDIITIPNNIDKTRKEEFIQFMQIVMQSPDIYQRINIDELLKNMFKMWNIPTYGLFKSEEDMQQEQTMQQQMMMEQQQQQQQQQQQAQMTGQEQPQEQQISPEQMQQLQQMMGGLGG